MSNISTIATYLARVSGQLQPMLEKVQGMDRRTFLLEAAALLALTSCSEPSGKAGMAPMISFKPLRCPRGEALSTAAAGGMQRPAYVHAPLFPSPAALFPDEAALHHHAQHGKPFRRRHAARARAE